MTKACKTKTRNQKNERTIWTSKHTIGENSTWQGSSRAASALHMNTLAKNLCRAMRFTGSAPSFPSLQHISLCAGRESGIHHLDEHMQRHWISRSIESRRKGQPVRPRYLVLPSYEVHVMAQKHVFNCMHDNNQIKQIHQNAKLSVRRVL